mmetsp:Transcript_56275/g.63704  ORF Transcript_56275/g.63704 Transcript_56275/m.63704 type:complete len:144 (+) Transcript_56275:80-511(+)
MMTESSPAQRLTSTLNRDPDIEYVAYIAEISIATGLLTIRKTKKQLNNNIMTVLDTAESSLSEQTTLNIKETPESYAASIIRALSLEGNSSLLLTCCWMSRYQKRYFHLYPTTFGFDVTHGTNAEKRPLERGTLSLQIEILRR